MLDITRFGSDPRYLSTFTMGRTEAKQKRFVPLLVTAGIFI